MHPREDDPVPEQGHTRPQIRSFFRIEGMDQYEFSETDAVATVRILLNNGAGLITIRRFVVDDNAKHEPESSELDVDGLDSDEQ